MIFSLLNRILFTFAAFAGLGWLSYLETSGGSIDTGGNESLKKLFKYVDQNEERFVDTLREAVAIPSLSCVPDRSSCFRMVEWTKEKLAKLGFTTELRPLGYHVVHGINSSLPPVLLGTFGNDPNKKTLLVYGHLDVQPAEMSDGWNTDPFKLTEINGNMYGRGSSDDKGPIIAWISALESHVENGIELPVNIKVVYECMEECGSVGLAQTLEDVKDTFLKDVDIVTISDTSWMGKEIPCLVYGLRGLVYFHLEVKGAAKDLHSGQFGGATHEAMSDLIWLLDRLVDGRGNITIPGIMDDVVPLTQEESALYDNLDFDVNVFQQEYGIQGLNYPSKKETLMARWRYPSLAIHGIEGAFSGPGSKTVIPGKVIGKFSVRLVNNQKPEVIKQLVGDYLQEKWTERNSPNEMTLSRQGGAKPWLTDPKHPNYACATNAIEMVWGVKPQFIRVGGSIPITNTFQDITGKNILHLPLGQSDDAPHSQNEKMSRRNFMMGIKLILAYVQELGKNSALF